MAIMFQALAEKRKTWNGARKALHEGAGTGCGERMSGLIARHSAVLLGVECQPAQGSH